MDLLDELRLFVAIAEQGSLSAAARAQALAASTVTLGLQRLERRLGARLIVRTTRRLSLTPEGERFLSDCRRILAELDEALENVAERGELKGALTITSTNDFGRTHLAPLVSEFADAHPGVEIELLLSDVVVDLVEQRVDLGIRTGPLEDSSLHARLLIPGSYQVCAAPTYWARAGKPAHPRELAGHNCLVLSRPQAPYRLWRFDDEGRTFTVKVRGNRRANDGGILRQWAIAGAGVIIKPSWDIAADLAAGRLEVVLESFNRAEVNLYAVYPPGGLSRRGRVFMDFLMRRLSAGEGT